MKHNKTGLKLFIKLLDEVYQSGNKIKGLNAQDEWYLDIIYGAGEISSSELARLTGVTKSAITPVTKKFIEKGYVTKRQSDVDRRTYYLSVSDTIKAKYEAVYAEEDNYFNILDQRLTDEDKKAISSLAKKLLK